MITTLGFILILILNDLQIISGTFSPTIEPTQAPLIFPDDILIRNSIIVNGTMSPEIIPVCLATFTPCINPLIGLIYVPIDYDGIDESNEFIRVNRPIFGISIECASSVANNCSTVETCGPFDVGAAFGNQICVDIEIGSDVDIQCTDVFGIDISDRTFIGQLNLYCDSPVTGAPTSSPTPGLPVEFLNCGDTIIGDTSLPGNFEDRFLFRLDFAGTITFSSCGSSFDTFARIYDINGTQIAIRDDGTGCPVVTNFNFDFTPNVGQTFIFGISGYGLNTGNYNLTAICTPFNPINITLPPTSQPTTAPTVSLPSGNITSTRIVKKGPKGEVNIVNKYYIHGDNNRIINNNHFNNKYNILGDGSQGISCPCFDTNDLITKDLCTIDYMGGRIVKIIYPNRTELYSKEYMVLCKNDACQYIINNDMIINKRGIDPLLFEKCINIIDSLNISSCGSSAQALFMKATKDVQYMLAGHQGLSVQIGLIFTIVAVVITSFIAMYYIALCARKKCTNNRSTADYALVNQSSSADTTNTDSDKQFESN